MTVGSIGLSLFTCDTHSLRTGWHTWPSDVGCTFCSQLDSRSSSTGQLSVRHCTWGSRSPLRLGRSPSGSPLQSLHEVWSLRGTRAHGPPRTSWSSTLRSALMAYTQTIALAHPSAVHMSHSCLCVELGSAPRPKLRSDFEGIVRELSPWT